MDIRYRHSRGKKRATLATIREGDLVYWGVAKCNVGDMFNKAKGRAIAFGRAELTQRKQDSSLLRGCCKIEDIKQLLKYFDNIHKAFYRTQLNTNNWEQLAGLNTCGCNCDTCDSSCPSSDDCDL
jgi:hypothetical protein